MYEVTRKKWNMLTEKAQKRESELPEPCVEVTPASVQRWQIDVRRPSALLRGLYHLDSGPFAGKLHEQAAAAGVPRARLAQTVAKNVPGFFEYFREDLDLAAGQRGTSR